jgi:nucleotide-binding universal stress UspA family protein
MSSTLRSNVSSFSGTEPTVMPTGPVLVASDASADADAAFPLAQVIAAHSKATVQVITVMQPFTMPLYGIEARASAIRDQMTRLLPMDASWPVSVLNGEPVREIIEQARRTNARVLVVGRGRHGAVDRVLGGESVLRLLQLGDTPVFAVEGGMTRLPRCVVIATEFSVFSLYAAQVAMSMIAPDATVHLVNVGPPFVAVDPILRSQAAGYREQAMEGFAVLHERLERDDVTFTDVLLEGNASDALLNYAKTADADVIVLATHGYGFLRRAVLGSVAAELVRRGVCSLLIVPGSARTLAAARAQSTTT